VKKNDKTNAVKSSMETLGIFVFLEKVLYICSGWVKGEHLSQHVYCSQKKTQPLKEKKYEYNNYKRPVYANL
jgi:hypothetical protein